MKLLLDTHVLLWALGDVKRLSLNVRRQIEDPDNDVLFSAVSIWEIAIKSSQGRSDFSIDPRVIDREARVAGFAELPISAGHALAVQGLPSHHRDPFDRLLIAQALTEPAWLYTSDKLLVRYEGPVRLLDAAS
ncbi:MAG: type II toxin-antitoxin system VapC family toxin [Caldimonas sp.]